MKHVCLFLLVSTFLLPGTTVHAEQGTNVSIQSLTGNTTLVLPDTNDVAGVSLVVADLGSDGKAEILVGSGMGSEPRVRVLRQDGSEIGSFLAYANTLGVGIHVTACDLTGDGFNEVIVSPQRGGGPHIRIFDRYGVAIDDGGFFAYAETMRDGVNLACGDLLGDARAEFVTLPAPGGGPHVRIWSWNNGAQLVENFFAYHASDRSGVIGVIDEKKLFLSQQFTSTPTIKEIVIHNSIETQNEQQVTIDGLGVQSLAVIHNELLLSTSSTSTLYNLTSHTTSTLPVTHAVLSKNDNQLFYTSGRLLFTSDTESKRIDVDVSEQRLYAFEQGILRNSFLISSGKYNTTPLGDHTVLAKIPLVHYAWNYGPGNPNNYDLGWIPYNLRFSPHIYIHYAPWHNNFGQPMSRGCVNVNLSNVQWVYEWAEEGIPVRVRE